MKTSLIKKRFVFFKPSRDYSESCEISKIVELPRIEFLGAAPKFTGRKKKLSSFAYVLHKTSLERISRRCRSVTVKKCNARDAHAKLLFCSSKPIAFLTFSFPLPSPLLNKLPDEHNKRNLSQKMALLGSSSTVAECICRCFY